MTTDTDTIKSVFTLAGGALGFLGAVIAFITSRLNRAETIEAKYRLYINLATTLEICLWLGGFITTVWFDSLQIGIFLMSGAYLIHAYLFMIGRSSYLRGETVLLVICTGFIIFLSLATLLQKVVKTEGKVIEVLGKTVESVKILSDREHAKSPPEKP